MLHGKLALHDVEDVEALAAYVIQRSGVELSYHEHEELLSYLVEVTWELSLRYEEGIIRKGFSLWATTTLKRRVVEWQRRDGRRTRWQFADRTYERELPRFVQADDDLPASLSDSDSGSDVLRGLVRVRGLRRARDKQALSERALKRHEEAVAA